MLYKCFVFTGSGQRLSGCVEWLTCWGNAPLATFSMLILCVCPSVCLSVCVYNSLYSSYSDSLVKDNCTDGWQPVPCDVMRSPQMVCLVGLYCQCAGMVRCIHTVYGMLWQHACSTALQACSAAWMASQILSLATWTVTESGDRPAGNPNHQQQQQNQQQQKQKQQHHHQQQQRQMSPDSSAASRHLMPTASSTTSLDHHQDAESSAIQLCKYRQQ